MLDEESFLECEACGWRMFVTATVPLHLWKGASLLNDFLVMFGLFRFRSCGVFFFKWLFPNQNKILIILGVTFYDFLQRLVTWKIWGNLKQPLLATTIWSPPPHTQELKEHVFFWGELWNFRTIVYSLGVFFSLGLGENSQPFPNSSRFQQCRCKFWLAPPWSPSPLPPRHQIPSTGNEVIDKNYQNQELHNIQKPEFAHCRSCGRLV